jgi:hypothetical protein
VLHYERRYTGLEVEEIEAGLAEKMPDLQK